MKTETLMWLLPIVFMLHDFEEIIMVQAWVEHNAGQLRTRFPQLAARLLPHLEKLSTSSFALAVAEEFVLLSVVTYVTVELELYSVWAGILVGFFIHLIAHIVQFAIYQRYIPAIFTSVLSTIYCLGTLYYLSGRNYLIWAEVFLWTFIALIVIVTNVILAHKLAAWFEQYLKKKFVKL